MKTYSRKKSGEPQEDIVDFEDICRLCMGKENEFIPIFHNEDSVPLTLKIMACVALEIFEGDGLPDKICHPCKFQLEKSYHFRKKCENSDLKLRHHLKEVGEKVGDVSCSSQESAENHENQENTMEIDSTEEQEISTEQIGNDNEQPGPSTEQDLVGIHKVSYIEQELEELEDDSTNIITLPPQADTEKEACTLKPDDLKSEPVEEEDEENIYIIEENDQTNMDDASMDVIADAVKATLASQPGINANGQLQLKVNKSDGRSAQVEVTTEDGHVIVMEILTEDQAAELTEGYHSDKEIIKEEQSFNEEGELKIFRCPDCPKSFSRKIQLRRHASVHMQQRGFSCGICEKWFPTRSALIRHERIHTGERPFQCEVCQKSFAQKEILFRHLMTHTGQKPYACTNCPKGFTQKEQLRVHMKTHVSANPSDIQLHYCSLCPKVFCHASGLSRHLVTHTGKTFKCRDCDKNFTDKSSLRRHHLQTGHQS